MNPGHLFALTPQQKLLYSNQPDQFIPPDRTSTEEFEVPDFVDKIGLRLWYNTQTDCYARHWHDAQEIVIALENGYTVTVQDTEYHLLPGDIFVIPPGELHAIQAPSCGARFVLLLDLNLFGQIKSFLQTRSLLATPIWISSETCPEIYERSISLFMEIASLYWGGKSTRLLSICARMLDFYACYAEFHLSLANKDLPRRKPPLSDSNLAQKLDRLLEYLQEQYAGDISLEEAAQMLGLSKYYFTRIFRQHMGQTFNDYLTFLRIQAAEELLQQSGMSMSEICAACGYSSVSSFNRNFHKLKGCSPTEFRKLYHRILSL